MQLSYYIHNNSLRVGIVKRLIDYRWSSYPAFDYNRRHPMWFDKDLIRFQIHGENKHRQYREKSQKYSDENRRIWEDIRHGFIYGSNKDRGDFILDILFGMRGATGSRLHY
jgi:hypothetical protein